MTTTSATNMIELGEESSSSRIVVELLLYFSIAGRAFGNQLGILKVEGLSGAIIALSGLISFCIIFAKKEKLPSSIYFAIVMNILANVSELAAGSVPGTGWAPKKMLFWMSLFLMTCYVVKNDKAAMRFCFFLAFCVLVAVSIGATDTYAAAGEGFVRLRLEGDTAGSMFKNANSLGQVCYMATAGLLFFSLRCRKMFKVLCWLGVLLLMSVLLRTISRQSLVMSAAAVFFYLLAVGFTRGGKIGFLFLVLLVVIGVGRYAFETRAIKYAYEERFHKVSGRVGYWHTAPKDMVATLVVGQGKGRAFSSAGYLPHNTFLYLHYAFGGVCAWTYVTWLVFLAIRMWRLLISNEFSRRRKIEALAFFLLFLVGQVTTVFAPDNYGNMFAAAMIERYISLFSRRAIELRHWENEAQEMSVVDEQYEFGYA